MTIDSNETAVCCAQFYEQDWVQTILGNSFHPGGTDTRDLCHLTYSR